MSARIAPDTGTTVIDVDAAARSRLGLAMALRSALRRGRVGLHYQAVADLATGRIVGAEALLRFHHAEHGIVPAPDVITLAHHAHCIVELGTVVIKQATQQLAAWRRDGKGPDFVSVNVVPQQLLKADLLEVVLGALRDAELEPHDLCIELTESQVIAEDDRARANLKGLDQLGVRLALDDFGGGDSSLYYLRRIPAQSIKIERRYIEGVDTEPECEAIYAAITALCRSLGRTVIAEGVETAGQLETIRRLGCHQAQGHILSRPVHPHAFPEELHAPQP